MTIKNNAKKTSTTKRTSTAMTQYQAIVLRSIRDRMMEIKNGTRKKFWYPSGASAAVRAAVHQLVDAGKVRFNERRNGYEEVKRSAKKVAA